MTHKKIKTVNELLLPYAFGKSHIIRLLLVPLLIKGHLLINDLPGVGKTTLSKAFATVLGLRFTRLQGTSDTLPQDIIGGEAIDMKTKEFMIRKGPLFTEIILIDEINRMHPKSQSAFLEAMEEGQVSIAGQAFSLPEQHMVIATQNPLEQSGTYPLPEAQKDRFSCSVTIGVPSRDIQKNILSDEKYVDLTAQLKELPEIMSSEDISLLQKAVHEVKISDIILERLMDLSEWTRDTRYFRYGLSLRGLTIIASAMRANAVLEGRDYVVPEDGKGLMGPFLSHRIEHIDNTLTEEALGHLLEEKYQTLCKGL